MCMNVYKSQLIFFLNLYSLSILLQFSFSSLYERSGFRKQIYIDINILIFFSSCLSTPKKHQLIQIQIISFSLSPKLKDTKLVIFKEVTVALQMTPFARVLQVYEAKA